MVLYIFVTMKDVIFKCADRAIYERKNRNIWKKIPYPQAWLQRSYSAHILESFLNDKKNI